MKFDWSGTEVVVRERYGAHPRLDVWATFPYPDRLQERLKDEAMDGGFATGESSYPDLRANIEKAGYLREETFDHDVCEGYYYEWGTGIRMRVPSEALMKAGDLERVRIIRRFLGNVVELRHGFDEESSEIKLRR